MSVFQGVAPSHTNFISSCVIPLWDSATAHSHSVKELNPFSHEDQLTYPYCFVIFLHYPAWSLFGLVLTHVTHEIHMCIYTIFNTTAFQKRVAEYFVGVTQIRLLPFFFFVNKTSEINIMVYHKKVPDYAPFTVMITNSSRYFNF